MILKFFLAVINPIILHAAQMGDTFTYNALNETPVGQRSECERRMLGAIARVQIGSDSGSYGGIGVCDTDLINTYQGRENALGTGFLVSLDPPILVTNRHNLRMNMENGRIRNSLQNNINPCSSGNISFNFTGLGETVGCKNVRYSFHEGYGVDAAFIELDRLPENANFLRLSRTPPTEENGVTLVGHPFGSDNISAITCNITSQSKHDCDSVAGASGSALVDHSCNVVGLHGRYYSTQRSEGDCDQQRSFDSERMCMTFEPVQDHCRNTFDPSNHLQDALSLILNGSLTVADPNLPFDQLGRYGLRQTTAAPTPASAPSVRGEEAVE